MRSSMKLPSPEPVPPAIECRNMNPCQKKTISTMLNRKPKIARHLCIMIAPVSYLQRVTAICFTINHIKDLFLHDLACRIACSPVVSRANTLLPDKEVLWIVDVSVRTSLDGIEDLIGKFSAHRSRDHTGSFEMVFRGRGRTLGSKSSRIARGI